jgi:Uma2 family endonuclease
MATVKSPATIEDLERLVDSECRYDLIRGELIEMAPAGGAHGEIAAGIIGRLGNHVTANQLGRVYTSETGFVLARQPDVVLASDAAFISSDRVPERQCGFYEIAPDLTIEIMPLDDSFRYLRGKVMEYLDAGVRLVWIVDPERQTITTYEADRTARILTINDTLDSGDVLPGLSVPVADIFA